MPDNKSKIKFDEKFLARCDHAVFSAQALFNAIAAKYKTGREGDLSRVVKNTQLIKAYAYKNIGRIPPSDKDTQIEYTEAWVRSIRNSKQSLITLFKTVNIVKQQGLKGEYAKALDLYNQFQTHLEERVNAKVSGSG